MIDVDLQLARSLILDESFDLSLYRKLRSFSSHELRKTLDELIIVEARHFAFWQEFFNLKIPTLNPTRKVKFWLIVLVCRCFGGPAIDLVLEAIEVYGIRKYLTAWEQYKDTHLGAAIRSIKGDVKRIVFLLPGHKKRNRENLAASSRSYTASNVVLRPGAQHISYCRGSSCFIAGSEFRTVKQALVLLPKTVLSETLKAYCFVW